MQMDPITVRELAFLLTVVVLLAITILALRATQPERRRKR
jgi:hypothetical protein